MARPRLLDLFSGAGGAAMGYHRAGFDVVGVDIRPQSRYPFEFIQADAMLLLDDLLNGWPTSGFAAGYILGDFAAIHASPPCQAYTMAGAYHRSQGKTYPDLIEPVRALLQRSGLPWVMENVVGAPVRPDFRICGCQVGLPELRRVRWFETSWRAANLASPCHHTEMAVTVAGRGEPSRTMRRKLGLPNATAADWRRAMGIDWMTRDQLAQAIPPAYTEHIGQFLLAAVAEKSAA